MKAADELTGKTPAPNQLWQTDFTYLSVALTGCPGSAFIPSLALMKSIIIKTSDGINCRSLQAQRACLPDRDGHTAHVDLPSCFRR
jgi:hypothetical protein